MKAIKIDLETGEGIEELIDILSSRTDGTTHNVDRDMAMRIRHVASDVFRAKNHEQFNKFFVEEFQPGLLKSFDNTLERLVEQYKPIVGEDGAKRMNEQVRTAFRDRVMPAVLLTEKDKEKMEKLLARIIAGEFSLNL